MVVAEPIHVTARGAAYGWGGGGAENDISNKDTNNKTPTSWFAKMARKLRLRISVSACAILPLLIVWTYTLPPDSPSVVGGLFPITLRIILGWSFVFATIAATRPLLQTFLNHAVEAAALELKNPTVNIGRVSLHFYNRLMLLSTTATQYMCVGLFLACLLSFGHLRGVGSAPGWFSNYIQMDGQDSVSTMNSSAFVRTHTPVYDAIQNTMSSLTPAKLCSVLPVESPNQGKVVQKGEEQRLPSFDNLTGTDLLRTAPPVPLNVFDLFQNSKGLASSAKQDELARKILLHGRR